MAVAATQLTQGTGSGTSIASASISPTGNRLILIGVGVYDGDSLPNVNSVTGNGITYALVASSASIDDGFGPYRVHLYRGMAASPSAGAVTISLSGVGADQLDYSIAEFSGVDTGGTNGADAVVQSAIGSTNEGSSLTITLAAFGDAGNGAYCTAVSYDGVAFTPDTGWTSLDATTQLKTEWRASPDTSAGFSWSGTRDSTGVAIEIKAAGGGGGAPAPRLLGATGVGT